MNKITSILAGLAITATASIAPAFAQGELFTLPGGAPFTITSTPTTFTESGTAGFNPAVGNSSTATTSTFSFTGTLVTGTTNVYSIGAGGLKIGSFTDPSSLSFVVATLSNGNIFAGSLGSTASGSGFSLTNSAPVPEASTVVSFGALLALGGLAVVLRRKGGVKNAA